MLNDKIFAASNSRFDELFPQFPQLLSEGRYDARIVQKEGPIEDMNQPGRPMIHQNRMAKNAAGTEEWHCLELSASEEPTISGLYVERDWVHARIASLPKKD